MMPQGIEAGIIKIIRQVKINNSNNFRVLVKVSRP
jgi:hypothetical protein